jgi:hypothetical protein
MEMIFEYWLNVTARYNEARQSFWRRAWIDHDVDGWYFRIRKFWSKKSIQKDIVTEIAATMAFSATQNNDKIGLILFSDQNYIFHQKKDVRMSYELFENWSSFIPK